MLASISAWIKLIPYKDLFEILFFSMIIYQILMWLKRDTERNLILGFYLYSAFFAVAYYADLPAVRFFLFVSAPIVAILFIILHQETLQKNFIKALKAPIALQEKNHWVDELVKCCLTAVNKHKEIVLVLERNDLLKNLIHAPYFIYAELKRDVFDLMLEKHINGNDYVMWMNQQGKIVAINCTWRTRIDETWISKDVEHMHVWKQQALYISARTDALILKINPLTRSFDLITQGRITETMNADQAAAYLRKHLISSLKPQEKATAPVTRQSPSEKSL